MNLPPEIQNILDKIKNADHEAYAVGGCVRDLLLKKTPKDWDIAASAKPARIQDLFPKSFYNNRFGTVTVLTGSLDPSLQEVEVTTYRTETEYTDKRHPASVSFTQNIEDDLARRDFTINAMAMIASVPATAKKPSNSAIIENMTVIDPFGGLQDLHKRSIRAVGNPEERFNEDALRLIRAVRFASELNFTIEEATYAAIKNQSSDVKSISQERIRDELIKIVMSDHPEKGFNLLLKTGILKHVLPEVAEGVGIGQNKHHIYTVYEHCVKSLQFAADYNYSLPVRLAALFHDIGKPRTKKKYKGDYTFYAHDIVGKRMTENLMKRLRFSKELTDKVAHLVRHHMFYYDVGKVTEAGARRLLRRVGKEHFDDLIKVRIAERKGSGVPKAQPYRLRHLRFLVEKAAQEPLTTSQLAISGHDLIKELNLKPGPQIGGILNALLAEVIDDPAKNTREYLLRRAIELKDKDPKDLKNMGAEAVLQEEKRKEDEIKKKYGV